MLKVHQSSFITSVRVMKRCDTTIVHCMLGKLSIWEIVDFSRNQIQPIRLSSPIHFMNIFSKLSNTCEWTITV